MTLTGYLNCNLESSAATFTGLLESQMSLLHDARQAIFQKVSCLAYSCSKCT